MERSRREAELYRAAARVFRRKGLQQTRLQDVADELGVPRGALYYYVASRDDLVRAVVETPLRRLLAQAREIAASKASPEAKLTRLIAQHLKSLAAEHESWLLLQCEGREALQEVLAIDLQALLRQYETCWNEVIAEGIEQGVFVAATEPDVAARACLGLVQGVYCWQRLTGEEAPGTVAAWLTPLVLQSLQGAGRSVSASLNT